MRPTSSMSLCLPARRTHFWIVAARGGSYGTGSSPRKYGTNCIIPEFVNIGAVGCVGIRLGRRARACARARRRSRSRCGAGSTASMSGPSLPAVAPRLARFGLSERVRSTLGAQLGLALAHGRRGPSATAARRSAPRPLHGAGEVGRHPLGRVARDRLAHEPHAARTTRRSRTPTPMHQPEEALEHRLSSLPAPAEATGRPGRCRRRARAP